MLLDALKKFDITILNDKKEVKIEKSFHSWQSICKRAPNYFEIMLKEKPAKEYQTTVFNQLYMIFPKAGSKDMKSKVQTFLRRCNAHHYVLMVVRRSLECALKWADTIRIQLISKCKMMALSAIRYPKSVLTAVQRLCAEGLVAQEQT